MTIRKEKAFPMAAVMGRLLGYIYCMLLSNMLTGMPLYGGALYLCGRAVMVYISLFGKKNRKFLPVYSRTWAAILLGVLILLGVILTGIYPASFESSQVWVVFSAVILCLCADGMTDRMERLTGFRPAASGRSIVLSAVFQIIIAAVMAVILIHNLPQQNSWQLAVAFAVMIAGNDFNARHHRETEPQGAGTDPDTKKEIRSVMAYHSMEWISLLMVMAVELTITTLYALLATNQEWLLQAIAIAVLCTVIPSFAGLWILRRTERNGRKNPTWLLLTGLIMWLGGIVLCSRMLMRGDLDYLRVYIFLAVCTAGGTMGMTGLRRAEEIMPDAIRVTGKELPDGYWRMRSANWELARLMGDILALIALSIFCFTNGAALPRTASELASRFQPVMMIPVILVIIGAIISVLRFPLSGRYIEKIRIFLKIREKGDDNPALQRQLEHVVEEPYRQPFLTHFLMALLRPFNRHRLVNAEHIIRDDRNPLVFLGNHGEINGPIICNLFIPVPIRTWTISSMMFDRKEVTEYVYDNTFGKLTYLPVFIRKITARFIGWLSVNVMNQIESIPVYRGSPMKLRETLRASVEALEAGDNLLIFPEAADDKYERTGIGNISPGFLMLAEAYWKKTKKKMRFLPLYANRQNRTLTFGTVITYEPENGFQNEQERVIREVIAQVRDMAGAEAEAREDRDRIAD